MLSPLEQLKKKVTDGNKGDTVSTIYYLIKELGCLPEVIGREYEVKYDSKGRISRIKQLPMSIPSLVILMKEMEEDYKRQEREMKKSRGKGKR
ncbi:MAG: hypothetical protein CL811_06635 [Colwelliaceae bacterium]|jgi:hypothetical protein|nr:hypothetical protein [Colwelliaceae bacterium]|tara:strand:- start:13158 stop:13436 length:279 start_codon:yes stop_codon:yes gene_type:complete